MGGKTGWIELVLGVRPERRRDDEPERVQGSQTDEDEERMPSERSHEACPPSRPPAGSMRLRGSGDGWIELVGSGGSHVVTIRLRTHNDRPIRTLAMPSSITATLAAVPFAPFEKLLQM